MGTWLKRIGLGALALVVLCTVVVFAVDAHVRSSAGPRIVSVDEAAALGDVYLKIAITDVPTTMR